MKFNQWIFSIFVMAAVLLSGCQSPEYYQERAVNRAREYLLKKAPGLNAMQREYVKFNKPYIMSKNIVGNPYGEDDGVISPHALVHFNIAWVIPGKDEVYLVFGVSEPSMAMWFPERLIVKEFIQPDKKKEGAVKAGQRYALNTLLNLKLADMNHVRFVVPEFYVTNYVLDLNHEDRGITEQQSEALMKLTQMSMVWNSKTKPNEKIVVIGLGQKDLGGWKPFASLLSSEDEFMKHVVTDIPELEQPAVEPVEGTPKPPPKSAIEKLLEEIVEENEG